MWYFSWKTWKRNCIKKCEGCWIRTQSWDSPLWMGNNSFGLLLGDIGKIEYEATLWCLINKIFFHLHQDFEFPDLDSYWLNFYHVLCLVLNDTCKWNPYTWGWCDWYNGRLLSALHTTVYLSKIRLLAKLFLCLRKETYNFCIGDL